MTVTLDGELYARMKRHTSARGMNRFIIEAIKEKVAVLERQEIETSMREGYLSESRNQDEVIRDWSALDTVDWPDYE